jgi:hypothetical protein
MGFGDRFHVIPYRGLGLLLQQQVWKPMGESLNLNIITTTTTARE